MYWLVWLLGCCTASVREIATVHLNIDIFSCLRISRPLGSKGRIREGWNGRSSISSKVLSIVDCLVEGARRMRLSRDRCLAKSLGSHLGNAPIDHHHNNINNSNIPSLAMDLACMMIYHLLPSIIDCRTVSIMIGPPHLQYETLLGSPHCSTTTNLTCNTNHPVDWKSCLKSIQQKLRCPTSVSHAKLQLRSCFLPRSTDPIFVSALQNQSTCVRQCETGSSILQETFIR